MMNEYTKASIPTVDFSPFLTDDGIFCDQEPTEAQLQTAREIDAACRDHGFVHLIHFGLSSELRQATFAAAAELFHLPDDVKKKELRPIGPQDNMGYSPYGSESLNANRPNELKEAFNIRFPPANQNDLRGCPEAFSSLASGSLQDFYRNICHRYAKACALALQLPLDFFDKSLQEMNLCTVRFLHAPPCEFKSASTEHAIRVGEHTDFGLFTILLLGEHGAEGLQIKPVEGGEVELGEEEVFQQGWLDVDVPAGSQGAIVNTGALMARWTNDVWKATAHRVIVASPEQASRERFSIAFFVDPDKNALVDVHEKFCVDQPKKYEPILSSEYLSMKLKQMMKT